MILETLLNIGYVVLALYIVGVALFIISRNTTAIHRFMDSVFRLASSLL